MMKATPVSGGAAASGYYKTEGYYKEGTPEAEGVATWFGREASALGLTGPVDDALFASILDGQTYEVGENGLEKGRLMGRLVNGERQHRPGVDLTFSAPKDVSIAALVFGDDRVIKAHDAAVQKALTFIQSDVAETRRFEDGKLVVEQGGGLIGGVFRHDTSRALDPQLHSHAVISNMVRNSAGDITALHNQSLFDAQRLGSEIYRNELGKGLTELGYTVQRVGRHQLMELKEVPNALSDQFSKRREQIEDALEERGLLDTPVNASIAALLTRVNKSGNIDRRELKQSWLDEAKSQGITQTDIEKMFDDMREKAQYRLPGVTRDGIATDDATQAIKSAIGHLSERTTSFSKIDLLTSAQTFAHTAGIQSLNTALGEAKSNGTLLMAPKGPENRENYTTAELMVVEKTIAREVRSAPASFKPSKIIDAGLPRSWDSYLSRTVAKNSTLTDGQRDALTLSLTGSDRFVAVQGSAGTGKTYMLEQLAKYAETADMKVEGLGPSTRATQELADAIGNAETLQARLLRGRSADKDAEPSKTILVLDEASMTSNADMQKLLQQARTEGIARVVMLGDVKQLDSVSAGTPFDLLQKTGIKTAVMNDIVRQRNDRMKQVVLHSVAGEINEAFEKLSTDVHSGSNYASAAAALYIGRAAVGRTDMAVVTPSNDVREAINTEVRDGLKSLGKIGHLDTRIDGLKALHLSAVETADPRSYVTGDTLYAHRSSKALGLTRDHQYVVEAVNKTSIDIKDTSDGTQSRLPLSSENVGKLPYSVFAPAERDFANGDQVRFRAADKSLGIANGDSATIREITAEKLEVATADGEIINVPRSSMAAQTLDHAYALTGHDMQGATVDNIIVAMGSREYLADQKAFYVAISRARDQAVLVTDDAERLAERLIKETGEKLSAVETFLAAHAEKHADKTEKADRDRPEDDARDERDIPAKDQKPEPEQPAKDKEEAQLSFLDNLTKLREFANQKTLEDRTR